MGANHCLDWLGEQRNWLLIFGWLAFALGTMASAVFKGEWHAGEFPQFLRWLSQAQAAIWLPLLMFVPAFWLLNFGKTAPEVPAFVQIPIKTGFVVSVLMLGGLVFGYFRATAQQTARIQNFQKEQNDEQHNKHIAWIAQQKPTDPIVNILSLTGRFHDADVRDSAIAKVKSHPDWEAELIRLLNETELSGNEVKHLLKEIEEIINILTKIIKTSSGK
jgi:hypothetical protein